MINSQSASYLPPGTIKKWIEEAEFFKDIDRTERTLGEILTRDQVMTALTRSPPADYGLAKKIEAQIFEYEL
jgi:hypothetical protein